jgi:energy-coupling factor transporter ATP-binding protein EcfA2
MSRDFALLMDHLRAKTAEVELDVPSPQSSGDASIASRLARARDAAIRRGDRIARVFALQSGQRIANVNGGDGRPNLTTSVTENESRALLAAGARWTGPTLHAPKPRQTIDRIRIRNFRCIQEIEFPLTPLHALIGPNDSGKSTILDAVVSISRGTAELNSEVTAFFHPRAVTMVPSVGLIEHESHIAPIDAVSKVSTMGRVPLTLTSLVGPARVLRLDPDAMRQPTNLIAQGHPIEFTERGEGLAAVYDAFLSRRLDVFLAISRRFTELFPTTRAIQLTNPSHTTKALGVELADGRSVGPERLSEGMLYWLAFAALPYLQPTPLILIEEPENGLHPSRIGDVMQVLREVSNTSQIILATHHPLVINELQPDEVTLITRTPERGTIATPLSSTKNFEQRSKVYALGELWLNYADGDFERDLVDESTIPSATG